MSKSIVGRMPECGHVVAIDMDVSPRGRRELAKHGYDVLTLPSKEALDLFCKESGEHLAQCQNK